MRRFYKPSLWIPQLFPLTNPNLHHGLLRDTRNLLHSLTHGGAAQLGMRFDGNEVGSSVSDGQILTLLGACSNAMFLVTILVAQHFKMDDVAKAANDLYLEYGTENAAVLACVP
jgi:hypothetical protein